MSINTTTNIWGSTVTYILSLLRSNLTDSSTIKGKGSFSSARSATSDWVVSSFPQPEKYGNFPGYPIVIVQSPNISRENVTLNRTKMSHGRVHINVLDKRSTPTEVDRLSGQILNTFESNKTSVHQEGIAITLADSSPSNMIDGNDTIIRTLEYNVEYRNVEGYC